MSEECQLVTKAHYAMTRTVKNFTTYRHFKGNTYYTIRTGVIDTHTMEKLVIYMDDVTLWAIPEKEFLSEVPKGSYNPTGQKYRFEEVET